MSKQANGKLRVLMATPRYFPYMGGVETHVYETGRRLAQRGIDITILTTMPSQSETPLPREIQSDGLRIIRVPVLPGSRDLYIAPEMYSLIKQGEWDLVHCQGIHTAVPAMAMIAARQANIPYMVTFHTGGHSSSLRNKIRSTQWKFLRPLLAGAENLIGVSHFETEYFRDVLHLPQERFTVIPNGAALPALSGPLYTRQERTSIVSVGRLERYKGHQHMITALPEIHKQRPDAQLLILGTGPYENTLRKLAQDVGVTEQVEIRAVPAGNRKAMASILAQASLVTLMSEYEAHPIAVMEALSLQRPVLGMHAAGLQELAEQGFIRSIPLNSTPAQVAEAAIQQLESPLIPENFVLPTWEDCADRLQAVYENAIPQSHLLAA